MLPARAKSHPAKLGNQQPIMLKSAVLLFPSHKTPIQAMACLVTVQLRCSIGLWLNTAYLASLTPLYASMFLALGSVRQVGAEKLVQRKKTNQVSMILYHFLGGKDDYKINSNYNDTLEKKCDKPGPLTF